MEGDDHFGSGLWTMICNILPNQDYGSVESLALSHLPVAAFPVGSKSSAQYPFDLKIPSLNIHSISKSRRSKSIWSQNPLYPKSISSQNTIEKIDYFGYKIPSLKNTHDAQCLKFNLQSLISNYCGRESNPGACKMCGFQQQATHVILILCSSGPK